MVCEKWNGRYTCYKFYMIQTSNKMLEKARINTSTAAKAKKTIKHGVTEYILLTWLYSELEKNVQNKSKTELNQKKHSNKLRKKTQKS